MKYSQHLLHQLLSQMQGLFHLSQWEQLCRDDSGQDLIEYVLVGALIALAAITSMKGLAVKIGNSYNTITNEFAADT